MAGATTPPLDGFTLAILAVHSTDERFYADVKTVPGLPHSHWRVGCGGQAAAGLVGHGRPRAALSRRPRGSGSSARTAPAGRSSLLARAGPRREGARHHAHHDDRAGRDPGTSELGRRPMSTPWWQGMPPAVAQVSCDGREHQLRWAAGELRAPGHPDLESEKILRALAGENYRLPGRAGGVGGARRRPAGPGPGQPQGDRSGGGAGRTSPRPTAWTGSTGRAGAARMLRRRAAVDRGAVPVRASASGNVRTPWPCCSAWAARCRPG